MRTVSIDAGNGNMKTMLIENGKIMEKIFLPNLGILNTARQSLKTLSKKHKKLKLDGIGLTGAGRHYLKRFMPQATVKTEILCQFRGIGQLYPEAKTILDGGKEDSKIIVVRDRVIEHFIMNNICSGGLGVYIDSICNRFNISLSQFSDLALKAKNPILIAQKCAVLGMSAAVSALNSGEDMKDILKGVCVAVVRNFLSMTKGKRIAEPCVFTGGMSQIKAICRTFEEELGFEIIVPEIAFFTGAYGASLYAENNKNIRLTELLKCFYQTS